MIIMSTSWLYEFLQFIVEVVDYVVVQYFDIPSCVGRFLFLWWEPGVLQRRPWSLCKSQLSTQYLQQKS